jgi:hypothetical protein
MAMLYLGDLSLVPDLFAHAPLNRDDRPVIQFLAPTLTRRSAEGDKDWFTGEALADFTEALAERLSATVEPAMPRTAEITAARRAGRALFRYAIAARRGATVEADRLRDEVRELVPDVVASADLGSPAAALADAHRTLGILRAEQEQLRRQLHALEERLGPPSAEEGRPR